MKQILKDYNIMHVAFSLTAFICMNPYLIWGIALYYRASVIITFFIFICFIVNKRYVFNTKYLIYALIFAFYLIYLCLPGQEGVLGFNYAFVLIIIFLILKDIDKKKIYDIFSWIFVLSLVPSIIITICSLLGIDLDWTRMYPPIGTGKFASGTYYRQYFGAIFIGFDYLTRFRMCGMYDEPGVVGTISALLLVGDNFNLKRNLKNILLLIAGILSFSLAFIAIIILYFLLKIRSYKTFIFLIIIVIALNNIAVGNELIKRYVVDRLVIEDGWIVGAKRTSSSFDYGFQEFIQEGSVTHLIFGMGNNAHNEKGMSGSSYKNIIYNYGFFGFVFLIIWLVLFSLPIIKSKEDIILLLLFILSIYQRPLIFSLHYMIILFGGLANLRFLQKTKCKGCLNLDF